MLTSSNLFEHELRKLINKEVDRLKENLTNGQAVADFAAYQQIVGQIRGLRACLEFCDEARTICDSKK